MAASIPTNEDQTFHKGSLVRIDGLQSKQGQQFNGGYGLIVKDEPLENGRYAVKVFAIPKTEGKTNAPNVELQPVLGIPDSYDTIVVQYKWLIEGESKLFKPTNLQVSTQYEIGMAFAVYVIRYSQEYPAEKSLEKDMATTLHSVLTEAKRVDPTYFHPSDDERDRFLFDCGGTCNHAMIVLRIVRDTKKHFDMAVDHIQLIDRFIEETGHDNWKGICSANISAMMDMVNDELRDGNGFHPDEKILTTAHIDLAKAMLEIIDPADTKKIADYTGILGEAYHLAREHLEGAKLIRRALSMDEEGGYFLDDNMRKSFQDSLLYAQLMCPGMPFEGYHIMGYAGTVVRAVRNDQRHMFKLVRSPDGGWMPGAVTQGNDAEIHVLPIPTHDYNDPMFDPIMDRIRS